MLRFLASEICFSYQLSISLIASLLMAAGPGVITTFGAKPISFSGV